MPAPIEFTQQSVDMKGIAYALLFVVPICTFAQGEKWQRLYTGEDMLIDIDSSQVTFIAENVSTKFRFASIRTGRVKFRTVYSKTQALTNDSRLSYKTRVELIDFSCVLATEEGARFYPPPAGNYRLYETNLLNKEGKVVKETKLKPTDVWKEIRFGSMMAKLADRACQLINEKRLKP